MELREVNPAAVSSQARKTGRTGQEFGPRDISSITGDKNLAEKEKLEILAKEFESIFMSQMIRSMRDTVQKSGLFDGGPAEEMFTDMLDEEMARNMAFSQTSGLSSALVAQLSGMTGAVGGEEKANEDGDRPYGQNKPTADEVKGR